jgi:sec-independent protein translocase protein TatC
VNDDISPVQTILRLLVYLRRSLLQFAVGLVVATAILYWFAPHILDLLRLYLGQHLAFFGVMEPVLALLKLSSIIALGLLAPWVIWRISQGLVAVFGLSKKFALVFLFTALMLFYAGAAFCFFVTLPFGINFLLGYQSEYLRPVIAVGKFVDFVGFFLMGFGLIFELPLAMTLLCRLRICSHDTFAKYRRYAVLVIAIMAAMLTPTPDILNMALMGVPLYVLYEAGILIAKFVGPSHTCA